MSSAQLARLTSESPEDSERIEDATLVSTGGDVLGYDLFQTVRRG